ncbi:JmjC domain-containing protein [Priestia aryabhattai]
MFNLLGLTKQKFLEAYWRKKPLVIRGGASLFIDKKITKEQFLNYAHKMQHTHNGSTNFAGEDVIFCEDISSVDNDLKQKAKENGINLGVWHECWFDGSFSKQFHGIGRHFDDSDNFVIQQEGSRLWMLGSPNLLTKEERKSRIKHETGAGVCENFENEGAFVILEPGDVLYLPIFYPHWGISIEDSVSITFAVQSINPMYTLFPLIREILSDEPDWWIPVPAHANEVLSTDYISKLQSALNNPELLTKIVSLWYERTKEANLCVNEQSIIPNILSYQPMDFFDINWEPNKGIDEFSIQNYQKKYSGLLLSPDTIKDILKNAKEQNLNEFCDLIKAYINKEEGKFVEK